MMMIVYDMLSWQREQVQGVMMITVPVAVVADPKVSGCRFIWALGVPGDDDSCDHNNRISLMIWR